jgi:hypothetical protein
MKHESRFSDPSRAILATLVDYTAALEPKTAKNSRLYDHVLEMDLSEEQLNECVDELNAYIERFRSVPIQLGRFVGKVRSE